MIQGHCKACRLRTSPNYTSPCDWNRDVYADILSRYTSIGKSKRGDGNMEWIIILMLLLLDLIEGLVIKKLRKKLLVVTVQK